MRKLLYLFALLGTVSLSGMQADGGIDNDHQGVYDGGDDGASASMPDDDSVGGGVGGESGDEEI